MSMTTLCDSYPVSLLFTGTKEIYCLLLMGHSWPVTVFQFCWSGVRIRHELGKREDNWASFRLMKDLKSQFEPMLLSVWSSRTDQTSCYFYE